MKKYLKWSQNNFGDELNDLIFPSLGYTECIEFKKNNLENLDQNCVMGLGTLILKKVRSPVTVAGSGSDGHQYPSANLKYIFVRGKLTAEHLKLDKKYAIGDTSYFLKDYISNFQTKTKTKKIGIIPHWSNESIIDDKNLISPRLPIDDFIKQVSECETILSESLHGAICADILRIPFSPIKIGQNLNEFKWRDWASMLDFDLTFGDLNNHKFYQSKDSSLEKVSEAVIEHMEILRC